VVGGNLTERLEASRLRNALEGLVKL
jgi:hypothetical protein